MGAKGCVIFSTEPIHEYRDYLTKVDGDLSTLAWLYHMNHGIFMTPGVEEEWTLSIAHTEEHVQPLRRRVRGVREGRHRRRLSPRSAGPAAPL